MDLKFDEALHCAKVFEDYFGKFDRIDEYMRDQKLASLSELPTNPLFPLEDELFSDFTIHPNDMNFDVMPMPQSEWETLLNITSSHINISPVGRQIRLGVKETNTNKWVGFIRLGSPVINMKPRNELLGQVFTQQPEWTKRFNDSALMGFVIVPSQPFGYNYLGGKLLAAICTSHEVRKLAYQQYGMNLGIGQGLVLGLDIGLVLGLGLGLVLGLVLSLVLVLVLGIGLGLVLVLVLGLGMDIGLGLENLNEEE